LVHWYCLIQMKQQQKWLIDVGQHVIQVDLGTVRPYVEFTYFISYGIIRIIRLRKNGLKYVKIRLTQYIIYKHSLTNKYRKLVNVVVSCFQVYGKASRGL